MMRTVAERTLVTAIALVGALLLAPGSLFALDQPFGGKGLVAHLSFDEKKGSEIADVSGGDNSGRMSRPAGFARIAGPFGAGAIALVDPNQKISGSDRGFPAGNAAGTVSLWFNVPPNTRDQVLFCYGSPQRGGARGLWLVDRGALCFYFWGHPGDLHVRPKGGIAPDRWHHVAATYDGQTARLFFDGKLIAGRKAAINTRLRGHYLVGENLIKQNKGFTGFIDEVLVLDRAVTPAEVAGYYRKGSVILAQLPLTKRVVFGQVRRKVEREQGRTFAQRVTDLGFEEILFCTRQPSKDGHWYASFSHWCGDPRRVLYGDGGKLLAFDIKTGKVRTLLADPRGGIRDPQVHYDGKKIIFSYRKGGQPYYLLYEINIDGSGLRQLTFGPYDDLEPTYLPDGRIMFVSSRVRCNVPCFYTRVAVLYSCDGDGSNIRRLSANVEHENTPWVLPDGRIIYTRWEYVDRSQVKFHHLWATNPDGTGQMAFFGNMHGGGVYIDAKPIPGSQKIAMIHSPGHGQRSHEGFVDIVDPRGGPDARQNVKRITGYGWRDPYPLSEDLHLVAGPGHHQISLLTSSGKHTTIYRLPQEEIKANMWLHEPRPIRTRERERVIPPRIDLSKRTGTVVLQDVYVGRNMKGVKRGDIKKLLVMEVLHMPVKPNRDWQQMVSFDGPAGGSFSLEHVFGTVPVEEDGSAHFKIPALRPIFFVALDENDMSVKRMQSFMTVQPGESVSCVGCHEERVRTPKVTRPLKAMSRKPSRIEPIKGIPFVFDYPRDIQPILDKHCVSCHGYEKTKKGGPYAGKVMLSGARGIFYNQSYAALRARRQVADGFNGDGNRAPRTIGTSASPLMKKLDGKHHNVRLSAHEKKMIHYWIESAGTFAGTYAALGKGFIFPGRVVSGDVHGRRCAKCHGGAFPISKDDPRTHWLYNLDDPAKSVILLAPLSREAGGWGMCGDRKLKAGERDGVMTGIGDGDYGKILAGVRRLAGQLQRNKRYDMPGFEPHPAYIREMKSFGVLPKDYKWGGPEDMFKTDRAYWESFHYRP